MDLTSPNPQISSPLVPENKSSKITKKKLLIILFFFLAIIIGLALYFYREFTLKNNDDINLPGQTVGDFSGNIEEINDQSLIVTDTQYMPEQQPKKSTYKVRVNNQTDIKWEPFPEPYSHKIATPSAQAKFGDLKVGQRIQVHTKETNGNNNGGELIADSVTISHGLVIINGTINNFQDNRLELRAKPPSVPEEKVYQFKLDSNTEITSFVDQKKLSLSDLKNNIDVMIYADRDVNLFVDLKALKISIVTGQ